VVTAAVAAAMIGVLLPQSALADSSAYAKAVIADHPTAFYRFGDATGSTSFADSSGNGYTASSNSSDHLVRPGPFGEASQALAIGTDGAHTPALAPLEADSPRTVELWFKTTQTNDQCLFMAGNSAPGQSFSLCLTDGKQYAAPAPNTPGVYLQIWDADLYLPELPSLTDGNWHYIAVTLSGSAVTVYVDGTSPGGFVWNGSAYSSFATQPFTLPLQPHTTATPAGIGSAGWAKTFEGEIGEVAIYPTALTETRLMEHLSAGLSTTLPPTTETTTRPAPAPPAPPAACAPESPAGPTTGHRARARIVKGAVKLSHARSIRVAISLTLCGRSAESAGVPAGTHLAGSGEIDFAHGRAAWSIGLPAGLGGGDLYVISHRNQTFLQAALLTTGRRRSWVRVGSSHFKQLGRLGFLGQLAIYTNPAAEIALAENAGTTAHTAATSARDSAIARPGRGEAFAAAPAGCNLSGGATFASPLDLNNDKAIWDRIKAWRDAAHVIHSAVKDTRASIGLNPNGGLSNVLISASAGEATGLKVGDQLCPQSTAPSESDPKPSTTVQIASLVGLDPCLVGQWTPLGPYSKNEPFLGGVNLNISPTGTGTMTYAVTYTAMIPPATTAIAGSELTTTAEVAGPEVITGTAGVQVTTPGASAGIHRLLWNVLTPGITNAFPEVTWTTTGYLLVIQSVDGVLVKDEQSVFKEEVQPPTAGLADILREESNYDCSEVNGHATLSVRLPFFGPEKHEFVRLADASR
jgi:Concanavalin A-like lectin/glucanases superfamily